MERIDSYTPQELVAKGWTIDTKEVPDAPVISLRLPRLENDVPNLILRDRETAMFEITGLTKSLDRYRLHLLRYVSVRHATVDMQVPRNRKYKRTKARLHPVNNQRVIQGALIQVYPSDPTGFANRGLGTEDKIWSEFILDNEPGYQNRYVIHHLSQSDFPDRYILWSAIISPFLYFKRVGSALADNTGVMVWGKYRREKAPGERRFTFKNVGFCVYDIDLHEYVSNDLVFDIHVYASVDLSMHSVYIVAAVPSTGRVFAYDEPPK